MLPKPIDTADPAIDDVRAVRRRVSQQFGHDPERLIAYYLELQKQYRHRLIGEPAPAVHERRLPTL